MHEMITIVMPYVFFVGLALVPIQVMTMVKKAVKRDRFSDQLLQALAIDRLKGATQGSPKEAGSPEPREYYPAPPTEWEQKLLPVQQKDPSAKRNFMFGFIAAVVAMQVLGFLYI